MSDPEMSGKVARGKWRYIAFSIEADEPVTRRDLVGALLEAGRGSPVGDSFRLTVFERGIGILRVPHIRKDDAIALIRSISSVRGMRCDLRTLKTSGTIRKLKGIYLGDDRKFRDEDG
ncbi:MAG: hypothetical protein JSV90_07645 [Methanobacteriota archaeon]|nr:MAG: hypothetical protein JSV90_07645 [Euryarchaeota archaeon]